MIIQSKNIHQSQMFLNIDDLIRPENPVRVLSLLIDEIIQKNKNNYKLRGCARTGRPAYSAFTLFKIYIYGYINRITSSRCLENETYRNIELIWLIGDLHPDHKTISDFRKDNKELIKQFTKDIKLFLKSLGLIDTSTISIDGTKLKANASRDMYSLNSMVARLKIAEVELDGYLSQVEEEDKLEKSEPQILSIDDNLTQISKLEAEIAHINYQINEMNRLDKNYISSTDPDCNLMKSRDGVIPAYNVQLGCDTENHFIVYEDVTDRANDTEQLKYVPDVLNNELSIEPEILLADKGYSNLDDIQKIEAETSIQCYVPMPKEQIKSPNIEFEYDKDKDQYICSQGQCLTLRHKNKQAKNSFVNVYVGNNCTGCALYKECTDSKTGRHISRFLNHDFRQNHREKMKTSFAKNMSLLRKSTIEHIFGTFKVWLGKIPLLTRGIESVKTEIRLFTASYNLKRLTSKFSLAQIKAMIKSNMEFNCQSTANNFVFMLKFLLLKLQIWHFLEFSCFYNKLYQKMAFGNTFENSVLTQPLSRK